MLKNLLLAIVLLVPFGALAQLPDFTKFVEQEGPAVVNISTTQTVKNPLGTPPAEQGPEQGEPDDPFNEFFRHFMPNMPKQFESHSLGSGFIISPDGYIMTNAHVVASADEILVRLTDKREFKAKIIGSDRRTDVALIKIEAKNLPVVKFGDPAKLKVGEWVVAIGAPFGFENSVTAGIVSAKGRSLPEENLVPFIQTDVAVNPGNSGGPLFDMKGEVIGINSQIYSRTGGFMGLSFAIPIDVANGVAQQLRAHGKVTRGRIGVVIQPVTKDLAESFGLPKAQGALVNRVDPDGPAHTAGVQSGDVILKFDGKPVESVEDLPRMVSAVKPGTRVKMQIWRDRAARDVAVTVGEMSDEALAGNGAPERAKPRAKPSSSGITVSDLTAEQRKSLNVSKGGVYVTGTQGAAARAGIRRGDVILAINNHDVRSADEFHREMGKLEKGKVVALLVRRENNSIYIPLRVEPEG
jgi:serine protease Do